MKQLYIIMTLFLLSVAGWSQSETTNDLGLLLGGGFVSQRTTAAGEPINFGASVAFSADYARSIKSGNTSLAIEFPFVAEPANSVQSTKSAVYRLAGHHLYCAFSTREVRGQWSYLPLGFRRIWLWHLGRQRVLR